MGKLHTLKRAIQRNPENFMYCNVFDIPKAKGAYFDKAIRKWQPTILYYRSHSYRNFVRYTLRLLGYEVR